MLAVLRILRMTDPLGLDGVGFEGERILPIEKFRLCIPELAPGVAR